MSRVVVSLILGGCLYLAGFSSHAFGQNPPADDQIAAAVRAAPEGMQEGARVIGYGSENEFVTLREGTNDMVCLADEPGDDRFHVACYHVSLEPFMARGRELRSEDRSRAAVDSIRLAEIRSGELSMPEHPAALYSLTGSQGSANAPSGAVTDASRLHVVYVPYATGGSTGLPTNPEGNRPWLMDAGMPWAHIMISPGSE